LGQKVKLFLMFETISLQTFATFRHREVTVSNFKIWVIENH
jgi:hypothetical protein